MTSGGEQQRDSYELVPCESCPGNVRIKVPKGARLTIVKTIHHQSLSEEPVTHDCRTSKFTGDEPAYPRPRLQIGEQWQPLDKGWVSNPGMFCLENEGDKFQQVQPTPEQIKEAQAKVVEIGVEISNVPDELGKPIACVIPVWLVPPGEAQDGSPVDFSALRVRCRKGTTRCLLTVFPV